MEDIVILVSITLNPKPKIYWKVINDDKIEQYILDAKANDSKTTTIKFDNENLLNKEDKNVFELLPYKNSVSEAKSIMQNIIYKCTKINDLLWDEEYKDFTTDKLYNAFEDIENIIDNFNDICYKYDELNELLKKFPKLEQHLNKFLSMKDIYQKAKDNIIELVEYLCHVNCEFISEYKERWESTDNHITVIMIFEEKC